jgi:cytochrome c553
MNAADHAIEEIRAVRHHISARHGHDVSKYLAALRKGEKLHPQQLRRGKQLLARRREQLS